MTRQRAIEVVVANVKIGWAPKNWTEATIETYTDEHVLTFTNNLPDDYPKKGAVWHTIPREWLEEQGHLQQDDGGLPDSTLPEGGTALVHPRAKQ